MFQEIVQQMRPKKTKPWTLKVALHPSGVLLVINLWKGEFFSGSLIQKKLCVAQDHLKRCVPHIDISSSYLQDNVLLPGDFVEHIYHVGSSHDMLSIIQSGLILGGKDVKKGRHAVFFAAVSPMYIDHYREKDYDVTQPRIAESKKMENTSKYRMLV